jgi:dTMP kinase
LNTLIIIDGLDGSGKSTQANIITKYLQKMNKTVCLRIHPENDNWFGKEARSFLYSKGKSAHFASALFYMIDVIRSILLYSWRKNDFTIFVRYLMGTAYLPSPIHTVAYNFFSLVVPKSKEMFFLDVTPQIAANRLKNNREEFEMFENLEALKKVRTKALSLTRLDKWVILDSNKSSEEIATAIKEKLVKDYAVK